MGKAQTIRPLLNALATVAHGVVAAVLSPPCAACGHIVSRATAGALCDACWRQLELEATGDCWPFTPRHVDMAASLGSYEGALRLAVHALKYDARRSIGRRSGAGAFPGCDTLAKRAIVVLGAVGTRPAPAPFHSMTRQRKVET